jgi:hypothetical protein
MKPRTLQTFKILAVAAAAAGCARAVGTEIGPEPVQPAAPTQPVATAEEVRTPAPAPPASPDQQAPAEPSPRPLPPGPEPAALVALRSELRQAGPEKALQQTAHFRPLCDGDGYPLVGNVGSSKAAPVAYGPSAFCSKVREQAKR